MSLDPLDECRRAVWPVLDRDENVCGTSFAVSPTVVCTCAHVVELALNCEEASELAPRGSVLLRAASSSTGAAETVAASAIDWSPRSNLGGLDFALLRIELPDSVFPTPATPLMAAPNSRGAPFATFGYRAGYETMGAWARGQLGDLNAAAFRELVGVGQLGFGISPGFSGAPVWHVIYQAVIGMVVARDAGLHSVAFMIPLERIEAAGGWLQIDEHSDRLFVTEERAEGYVRVAQDRPAAVVAHLEDLLCFRGDPEERAWLFYALGEIGGERSRSLLQEAAEKEAALPRRAAREALRRASW